MFIPAYTEPAVTAGVNALLTSSAAALLTVMAPWLTVIGPEPAPEWAAHTPPSSGVDPTRLPLVEKSSLTRMAADAAATRAWTREIRSIVAALRAGSKSERPCSVAVVEQEETLYRMQIDFRRFFLFFTCTYGKGSDGRPRICRRRRSAFGVYTSKGVPHLGFATVFLEESAKK
jgi:hypothetical protein